MRQELQSLSAGALHMTVYDLLAHAYNRVAIQYYQEEGAVQLKQLMDLRRHPTSLVSPVLPPALQRELVHALLVDAARALSTFFGFAEMNFILFDHTTSVYRLVVREGPFFPHFQPGVYTQPFGTGLLGQCHLGRCTVLENDVSASACYVSNDPAVRAELCVPVLKDDEVLAIIDSGAYTVNAFTGSHAAFIEDFARYLAPAIADPLAFMQSWRPGLVHGTSSLAPLAQSLNFLYVWHEEWRSRFAELYTQVAQRNTELMALTDLSATLSTSLRLDTILATTVAKVADLLSCQVSWILLPDDDGLLRIRAQHGGTVTKAAAFGSIAPDSPQMLVYTRGEPLITNTLEEIPRDGFDWTFCRRNQIVRYATVPLRVRERCIGVMNVGRTHPAEELTDKDVQLLATFAGQIALAIENADLYEHSRLLGAAEERARLARDLHDTLAQSMLTILRTLEGLEANAQALPEPWRNHLSQARTLARQSIEEARRSVWNLPAAALEHTTLREALEQYVTNWSMQTGVRARFERKGQPVALAQHVENEVLLMVREALQNVARHAQATSVSVILQFGPAGMRLLITDDGAGFDLRGLHARESALDGGAVPLLGPPGLPGLPGSLGKGADVLGMPGSASGERGERDDTRRDSRSGERAHHEAPGSSIQHASMGLRGMRERAQLLGGQVQIESATGWGTRIAIILPRSAVEGTHTMPSRLSRSMITDDDMILGERNTTVGDTGDAGGERLVGSGAADATSGVREGPRAVEWAPRPGNGSHVSAASVAVGTDREITILLADDHPALREGLRQSLDAVAGIRVLGTASTAREATALARAYQPDVVLLDVRLPDEDGLIALRAIQEECVSTQVVMFTAYSDDASVVSALRAGATGYLNKDIALPHLVAAIRTATSGRRVFSPDIAARLRQREGLLVNPHARQLTPREREILAMLADGMRYRAIAKALCVSEATVKFHVLNLYQKLQSSSRIEALNRARHWGLLS